MFSLRPNKPPNAPARTVRPRASMVFIAALMGLTGLAGLIGCGAAPPTQHEVLNRITDVADPTYALVVESCDAARDAIIARTGTTYAEDSAAMDEVDRVCDPIVAGMETLRGTQLTVRAAIDAGAEGAIAEGLAAALRLWGDLQALVPQLRSLGTSGGES